MMASKGQSVCSGVSARKRLEGLTTAKGSAPSSQSKSEWSFSIPLGLGLESGSCCAPSSKARLSEVNVPAALKEAFGNDGFVIFRKPILSETFCKVLNQRLEEILRGRYSRGRAPDKAPRLFRSEYQGSEHIVQPVDCSTMSIDERKMIKKQQPPQAVIGPIGFSGNLQNVKVIQVINVQKADHLFHQLACSPVLGKVVAQLAGWKCGARLAQDQIWAKPPGAAPLAFHRDSPYFMFQPADVVTVWVALDDMDPVLGPLQYVTGSHLWGEGRVGVASQFFQSNGGKSLLKSAAERQAAATRELKRDIDLEIVSTAGLQAGGMSIHNGRTWHGSGKNCSRTRPRRGLGLHFVPANVRFTADAIMSRLWRPYINDRNENLGDVQLSHEDFPITWQPSDDEGNNVVH